MPSTAGNHLWNLLSSSFRNLAFSVGGRGRNVADQPTIQLAVTRLQIALSSVTTKAIIANWNVLELEVPQFGCDRYFAKVV